MRSCFRSCAGQATFAPAWVECRKAGGGGGTPTQATVRLQGDEPLAHNPEWWDKYDRVRELRGHGGWELLGHFPTRRQHVLDWGTTLVELNRKELLTLYPPDVGMTWLADEAAAQHEQLEQLPEGSHAIAIVEC